MHRMYFYLAASISIMTMPVSALAETAADPATADTRIPNLAPAANDGGFYTDLPAVNSNQLIGLIRAYRASLTHREQAKVELAEMTEDMDELSRDLLAMQAVAGELTLAQLQ